MKNCATGDFAKKKKKDFLTLNLFSLLNNTTQMKN